MNKISFVWNENKSRQNVRKHGVAFADAQTVFYDEQALLLDDLRHSTDEDRFIMLGLSTLLHVLVVCHCYRDQGGIIRIISARKATRREQRQYTENVR